jgi:hypothetical protein
LTSVLKPNARAALFDFVVYLNAEVEAALESLRRFHIKDIADNLIQVFENPGGDGAQLRTIWDIHCKNIVPRIQQWRGELRKILMDQGVPGGYVEKICAKFDVHVLIFRADDFYVVRGMSRKSKGDMSCPTLSILKGIEKHTSGRHVGMLLRDAQLLGSVSLEAEESWKLKGGRKPKVLGIPKPAGSQLRARAVESKVTVDIEEFLEIEEVLMSFNELFERVGETVIVEIPSDAAGAEAVLKAS